MLKRQGIGICTLCARHGSRTGCVLVSKYLTNKEKIWSRRADSNR